MENQAGNSSFSILWFQGVVPAAQAGAEGLVWDSVMDDMGKANCLFDLECSTSIL